MFDQGLLGGLRAVGNPSLEGVGDSGEGGSEAGEGPGLDDSVHPQSTVRVEPDRTWGLRDRWPIPGAQEPRASVETLVKGEQAMSAVQGLVVRQGRRQSSPGGREGFLDPEG